MDLYPTRISVYPTIGAETVLHGLLYRGVISSVTALIVASVKNMLVLDRSFGAIPRADELNSGSEEAARIQGLWLNAF